MLLPLLTQFMNRKTLLGVAALSFIAATTAPVAYAQVVPGHGNELRPDTLAPQERDFDGQQQTGKGSGKGIIQVDPSVNGGIRQNALPQNTRQNPDKRRAGILPVERGFKGRADLTPPEKHPQRAHYDKRLKRNIDHLEKTGNFRKETLDKMRKNANTTKVDKKLLARQKKIMQAEKEYKSAMAELRAQERALKEHYRKKMQAIEGAQNTRPHDGGVISNGGSLSGGGAHIQPKVHLK